MHDPRQWDSLDPVLARRRRGRHGVGRVAAWVAGVVVFAMLVTAGIGVAAVALFLRDPGTFVGCDLDAEDARRLGRNSFLYARDGSRLGAVPSSRNRQPVPLSRMGRWLPAATVAIEDRRF